MPVASKPFGLWESPITADEIAQGLRLEDVQWDSSGQRLVWLEQRSGHGVLVCQPMGGGGARDLTSTLSVRAEVGYGGGDFTVHGSDVYFVSSGRIYRQPLGPGRESAITPDWGQCASPSVSPSGKWVVFVHSDEGADVLAAVDSRGRRWPFKLAEGRDFFMQPAWQPDGRRLAWVAWDHPRMPWEGSGLYVADVEAAEEGPIRLSDVRLAFGDPKGDVAISQPSFSPSGDRLAFLCDQQGWMQPWLMDPESGEASPLLSEAADFGGPAWIQGLRWMAWAADGRSVFLIRNRRGLFELVRFGLDSGKLSQVGGQASDYTRLNQLASSPRGDRLAWIGSSSAFPSRVASLQGNQVWVWRRSQPEAVSKDFLSQPRPVEIPLGPVQGKNTSHCYGLFYPPCNPGFHCRGLPPAIINIHGGPTSQAVAEYNSEIQFFTSRGYAVLELNYRGSSGYGRAYIESLQGNWGLADVEDAAAAAEFLGCHGLADDQRLALSGGSAGGYTVLMALIRHPGRFKAAICRYAVTSLFDLATDTHKFESHYLDTLVGKLPESSQVYRRRSPVFQAHRIQDPVALFQGEDDQVVPRSQSDAIAEALRAGGVPHLYEVYAGEGHGFRKTETLKAYYNSVEQFLRKHLIFAPPSQVEDAGNHGES